LATITVDEYYSKHPAVGAKIDDEIRNQNWGVNQSLVKLPGGVRGSEKLEYGEINTF